MEQAVEKRRWGPEQRLEFIEFCLFWEGGVNRGQLIERFGVSVPQASNDLTLYRELAPGNMVYDTTLRRYVPTPEFSPKFLIPNADRYLVQLKAIADKIVEPGELPIQNPPSVDTMPIPRRRVEARILKPIIDAIRRNCGLHVHYHSMNANRPNSQWRVITPHAFAHDGLRWHVRAYCHGENKFKDFILSRFLEVGDTRPSEAKAEDDHEWLTFFDVVLAPNPKLSESQQKTIALDYGMEDGSMTLPVRCALLYYFNKRLRLDVAQAVDDAKETPVVVQNRKEFEQALKRTN